MSRVHFEDTPAAGMSMTIDAMESEMEMGANSQGEEVEEVNETGNAMESEMEMGVSSQGEEEDEEAVNETGKGKRKENMASSFSTFSNILAQCSSKDSTTKEISCASRRGCASQNPSATCAKGSI
jgi:hypothetical protein